MIKKNIKIGKINRLRRELILFNKNVTVKC